MLYFVFRTYSPNTAPTNRIMSWARGLVEHSVKAEFIFFTPSMHYDKVSEEYPNIKFTYMWDHLYLHNAYLKFISIAMYIVSFLQKLKKNDIIYIYACPDILKWVLKRKDVYVYDEITEHPEVSLRGNRFSKPSVTKFISDCKKLNGLFVISQNLKDYFLSQGIEEGNVHILNMTVDSTRFEGLARQDTERYIAYCGNASNNKDGVDQLLRAFALISQTHSDVNLYIIGPKPLNGVFQNYELTKELGIEDRVVFTGICNSECIPQLLKNAEICALARPDNMQAKYGFPTKLGEYLLTENPVVITDVGNIRDFLVDGESALIAKPDDIKEFADKLSWCLDNPKEASRIGRHGAEVAKREFNYYTETKKIIKILRLLS